MTVFYRSKELVIDNEAIVELLSRQRFALSDLSRFRIARRDDQARRFTMPAAVGLFVTVLATGSLLDSSAWWAAGVVAIVLVGLGGASQLHKRPRWQLLAVYRGVDVCLCSTTDEHMFGQVRRGLLRAIEANRR